MNGEEYLVYAQTGLHAVHMWVTVPINESPSKVISKKLRDYQAKHDKEEREAGRKSSTFIIHNICKLT